MLRHGTVPARHARRTIGVGIGTNPERKLDVVDGSSVFQMRFSDGTDEGGIGADGNGFFRIVGTIGGAFGTGSAAQGTFSEIMRVWSGGVGIGTSAPEATLHAATGTAPFFTPSGQTFAGIVANMNNVSGQSGLLVENAWSASNSYAFQVASNWNGTTNAFTPYFTVTGLGSVGVGTTDPCTNSQAPSNCKLSVAGAIQAYDVTVNNSWSDYVFDQDYRLAPLSEVAGYIRDHHHLPNIPSAEEVQEKGVSVGDMQAKLLAKIEELTLHMIEAEKENRELRERITRLEARDSRNAIARFRPVSRSLRSSSWLVLTSEPKACRSR